MAYQWRTIVSNRHTKALALVGILKFVHLFQVSKLKKLCFKNNKYSG